MPALPTRRVGNDDIPEMGLGLMSLSGSYGQAESDEERFKFLDTALEEGCTFWDTADFYRDSEDLLGKWFMRTGNRDKIFLATKGGLTPSEARVVNGTPEYIKFACDRSLKRLGIQTIDLYYLQRADPTVPIEKSVGALAELVKEGKVRYIGLSEVSASTLRRAHAVHPITAIQMEYSPFALDIEHENVGLLATARELGVAVIAYSPLGRGLLTGQYKSPDDFGAGDFRRSVPRYGKEDNFPKILQVTDELREIGKKHNATAGQVALAWVLAQGKDIVPIPGTKKVKYLKENIDATKIKFTDEEKAQIRRIAEQADMMRFERYPPMWMSFCFVDTPDL